MYSIISYLSNSDIYQLSRVNKKMCMICFADTLIFERRFEKLFPFNKTALFELLVERYPFLRNANLGLKEKTVTMEKYLREVVDRNSKWDSEVFERFVRGGVCSREDEARFYLFNVMRSPGLRARDSRFVEEMGLLDSTLKYFDLSELSLFEAMHLVFGHALSLPGEAQKIDRVMEAFGAQYYRQAEGLRVGNSEDSFFVLAFALVMLNSDLNNPAVKRRMSFKQFRRNLEGALTLSEQEARRLYTQVLRIEMVEGSKFVSSLTKKVWLCRPRVGSGYKKYRKAQLTVCSGELVVDGSKVFDLQNCCVSRSQDTLHSR